MALTGHSNPRGFVKPKLGRPSGRGTATHLYCAAHPRPLRKEIEMAEHVSARRDFLKMIGTALPVASALAPLGANARRTGGEPTAAAYDPSATFDVTVSEVEFRRTAGG